MAQRLRALVALAEDRVQFSAPTQLKPRVTLVPRDPVSFPDLHGHQTRMWCTPIHAAKDSCTSNKTHLFTNEIVLVTLSLCHPTV